MILECRECQALVDAGENCRYSWGDPSDGPREVFVFSNCPRCGRPFLTLHEDLGADEHHYTILSDPEILYPNPGIRLSPNLPRPIQQSHLEAQACFRAKAFTATAIMCRKTLEGLCAEHGVQAKSLVGALKELRDRGVIENRLFDWADALRIVGNEAAHDVTVTVAADDARDTLEFTNALLEYVFTFRDRFEAFKERRQKRRDA
jgi:hypothetical protein